MNNTNYASSLQAKLFDLKKMKTPMAIKHQLHALSLRVPIYYHHVDTSPNSQAAAVLQKMTPITAQCQLQSPAAQLCLHSPILPFNEGQQTNTLMTGMQCDAAAGLRVAQLTLISSQPPSSFFPTQLEED